jgi:hypothetical protein
MVQCVYKMNRLNSYKVRQAHGPDTICHMESRLQKSSVKISVHWPSFCLQCFFNEKYNTLTHRAH